MTTNRQENRAKARKDAAQQAAKLQATAEYLREYRAWNWVWPGDVDGRYDETLPRNCWFTGLAPRNPNPRHGDIELLGTHPYFGPSKRTLKRRKARRGLQAAEASQLASHSVMTLRE